MTEARPTDRVLDMGTGSGVNAILAAQRGSEVLGVDLNPAAVDAARRNADRHEVQARFEASDIYSAVDGTFDLMIIDPPFRWFAPATSPRRRLLMRATQASGGSSLA
ncbi:MAG: methyltransferase [Pseudonocardiales bacterium]|nr:methyltransferase [Pseudonocardiales bacterium]